MVLKKSDEELNLVFRIRIDDYKYTVHVTSDKSEVKCFGC